jgi:hypothetical protein
MVILTLLLSLSAQAQDCKAIPKALAKAGVHEASRMFVELAQCNPAEAKKAAAGTVAGLIGDENGQRAAMAAIRVGAGSATRAWMKALDSEERSPMVRALGKVCQGDEAIQGYLVDSEAELGETFWSQRWYRALVECRVPAVQTVLSSQLDKAKDGPDRVRYFAVVSAWAQNVGGASVPRLEKMIAASEDVEVQVNLIQAFVDAAQVGSSQGMDPKAAEAGAAAIKRLSVSLPYRAVEQARISLMALDDEQGADTLAKVRYNDLLQEDGTLLYGVVGVERAECKKGTYQMLHMARVSDPGQTWPDQLDDKVKTSAEHAWKMVLGSKCKDDKPTLTLKLPSAPFQDEAAYKAWIEETVEALQTEEGVVKTSDRKEERIEL